MPMTWAAKAFIVIAIAVGIYYGSHPSDRDRWLAALGASRGSATKLRAEKEQRKLEELRAAEEARWSRPGPGEVTTDLRAPTTAASMTHEEICAGVRDREALAKTRDEKLDASTEKLKLLCSDLEQLEREAQNE
jgi:hypothetical protein